MEDVEKPDDSQEAATMLITDLLRQTPTREEENLNLPRKKGKNHRKKTQHCSTLSLPRSSRSLVWVCHYWSLAGEIPTSDDPSL